VSACPNIRLRLLHFISLSQYARLPHASKIHPQLMLGDSGTLAARRLRAEIWTDVLSSVEPKDGATRPGGHEMDLIARFGVRLMIRKLLIGRSESRAKVWRKS
jgi:hypothetical protein